MEFQLQYASQRARLVFGKVWMGLDIFECIMSGTDAALHANVPRAHLIELSSVRKAVAGRDVLVDTFLALGMSVSHIQWLGTGLPMQRRILLACKKLAICRCTFLSNSTRTISSLLLVQFKFGSMVTWSLLIVICGSAPDFWITGLLDSMFELQKTKATCASCHTKREDGSFGAS
ncbi:hypothetical protein BDZ85DRAFT_121529 [Elsinoe ampelina]|uniref:Uncharacterized protein n=1 Tax=Elsinoe ampelina TaxID=302913 RepID=A0A6A6GCK3_9PEZI|nr:hypothetical protein BDZ85DRAFT_121529 [Elsinoe ampelina]